MNIVDKIVDELVPQDDTEKRVSSLKRALDELRDGYRDTISRILREDGYFDADNDE